MDNTVYQQKTSLELIVLHVMCEVALQSKSAQTVASNVYCEVPLNLTAVVSAYLA